MSKCDLPFCPSPSACIALCTIIQDFYLSIPTESLLRDIHSFIGSLRWICGLFLQTKISWGNHQIEKCHGLYVGIVTNYLGTRNIRKVGRRWYRKLHRRFNGIKYQPWPIQRSCVCIGTKHAPSSSFVSGASCTVVSSLLRRQDVQDHPPRNQTRLRHHLQVVC